MPFSQGSGLRVAPSSVNSGFSYIGIPKVSEVPAVRKTGLKTCAPGPWGEVEYHYLYLEAASDLVSVFKIPSTVSRWSFPRMDAAGVRGCFVRAGIGEAMIQRWLGAGVVEESGVFHVLPPLADIEALTAAQRGALYAILGQWEINAFQKDPVFITSGDVRDFLRNTDIGREHAAWFEKMCYQRGRVICFSDISALLARAGSDSEARRLFKLCSRTRTMIARLRISPKTDFEALNKYWSKGGRRKDVLTMLKSIAEAQGADYVDLIHLLPALPRKLLNSYPPLELAVHGRMPDCHWSSLNFFNYEPREYYLDTRLAASHVLENFAPVDAPYRFGDVLFFMDAQGHQAFHSCVFIADDIVFTKNGDNAANPWILSHLSDIEQVYLSATGGRIQAYRRK
jgi:hypothetical protein